MVFSSNMNGDVAHPDPKARYVFEEEIGLGVTSRVYRARCKDSLDRVAVKLMDKHNMSRCRCARLGKCTLQHIRGGLKRSLLACMVEIG